MLSICTKSILRYPLFLMQCKRDLEVCVDIMSTGRWTLSGQSNKRLSVKDNCYSPTLYLGTIQHLGMFLSLICSFVFVCVTIVSVCVCHDRVCVCACVSVLGLNEPCKKKHVKCLLSYISVIPRDPKQESSEGSSCLRSCLPVCLL